MTTPPRRLILCADDYGISPAVSLGIRELAAAGRLSATGVMSCMPSWPGEAPALTALDGKLAVGLHFTLTDQRPLGSMPQLAPDGRLPSIGVLLRKAFLGQLPTPEVAGELNRQLDAFQAHFGRSPDFIDGHQHAHLLPGVWPVVLAAFAQRLDRERCWLRDCTDRPGWLLRRGAAGKAGFIAWLGRPLAAAARQAGIRTNRGFSGFYDIGRTGLAGQFSRFLAGAADDHLMMVHPGHVDPILEACDTLTAPRQSEWEFLSGADFPAQLAAAGMILVDGPRETRHTPAS